MAIQNWTLEDQVNDFVKDSLDKLNLKNQIDFNVESNMSDYMKEALKGSAKTKNKTNFGKPDFHIEKYRIPIVIEDKLKIDKLIAQKNDGIKDDDKSISAFAVNGAIHYATQMIASGKYNEVIAIGVAGDNRDNVKIDVYFVYGSSFKTVKQMPKYQTFDFVESQKTFANFYRDCILTDAEKHKLLISSKTELSKYAKELNKLMMHHNITAPQRVLYVSGMLLSMQDIEDNDAIIQNGLVPDDLNGIQTDSKRDGVLITSQINEYLKAKKIPDEKRELMIASFNEISKDRQRDISTRLAKNVSKLIKTDCSANKQIFTYIYENIYTQIDAFAKNLDIMGELYSEFLKYALGDGKELGIVLTPPYVTKMMAQILEIDYTCKVMDLATGSAGFLISSMERMISSANDAFSKGSSRADNIINDIKKKQLLGIELNAEMFTLAATNMILRGDGSSNIQKGSSFDEPDSLYKSFNANRILLNPPFTYEENGMPFIAYGLDKMEGGLGAIIIQDSAGSGIAKNTNKKILKSHTLLASIKMPVDLFQPMAGVQTSIYVFEAKKPHDFEKPVKFIDFSNDGYKRTIRYLSEKDNPIQRYSDIIKIYKSGKNAKVDKTLWDLDKVYIEDFITDSGTDWNFEAHKNIDTKPTITNFNANISDYLAWKVSKILKNQVAKDSLEKMHASLNEKLKHTMWGDFRLGDLFEINSSKKRFDANKVKLVVNSGHPYIVRTSRNNGQKGYIDEIENYLNEGNTISFGQDTATFYYQKEPYFTGDKIKILKPKFERFNESNAQFILEAMRKSFQLFSWGTSSFNVSVISNQKIQLPINQTKEIDFDFMESFVYELEKMRICELELERLNELKAYLDVTGIKDLDCFQNTYRNME